MVSSRAVLGESSSHHSPHGDGPFQVLERINDNAYKLDLPGEYGVAKKKKNSDLSPFALGDTPDSRVNPSQEEGNDAVIQATTEGVVILSGPIMRARAKRMKEQLNVLVRAIQEAKEGSSMFEGSSEFVALLQLEDQVP